MCNVEIYVVNVTKKAVAVDRQMKNQEIDGRVVCLGMR
jgi:hypothetical protein